MRLLGFAVPDARRVGFLVERMLFVQK
jgi:hypothetical protein